MSDVSAGGAAQRARRDRGGADRPPRGWLQHQRLRHLREHGITSGTIFLATDNTTVAAQAVGEAAAMLAAEIQKDDFPVVSPAAVAAACA